MALEYRMTSEQVAKLAVLIRTLTVYQLALALNLVNALDENSRDALIIVISERLKSFDSDHNEPATR